MSNLAAIHNEIQTVNFHGHELVLVAHNDGPHVAMKTVCEAIGLDWSSQHKRMRRHQVLGPAMVMMTTVGEDGKDRAMVVLPLQYLNGWLFGIDVNRVKKECRAALIRYQRECFQALYDYWHQGVAINPRVTLTPAQQRALQELVAARAAEVPAGVRRGAYAKLWGAVKTEFRVGTYKDLPASQFKEAKTFLEKVVLEGEWIQAPQDIGRLDIDYPIQWWADRNPGQVKYDPENESLSIGLTDLVCTRHSPLLELLDKLSAAGYDVEGAFYELRSYQNILPRARDAMLSAHYMAGQIRKRLKEDLHYEQTYVVWDGQKLAH